MIANPHLVAADGECTEAHGPDRRIGDEALADRRVRAGPLGSDHTYLHLVAGQRLGDVHDRGAHLAADVDNHAGDGTRPQRRLGCVMVAAHAALVPAVNPLWGVPMYGKVVRKALSPRAVRSDTPPDVPSVIAPAAASGVNSCRRAAGRTGDRAELDRDDVVEQPPTVRVAGGIVADQPEVAGPVGFGGIARLRRSMSACVVP